MIYSNIHEIAYNMRNYQYNGILDSTGTMYVPVQLSIIIMQGNINILYRTVVRA